MQEDGFYVDSNPTYPDPVTGKSREYDISAVTTFDLLGRNHKIDFLWFHIVCECENNEQPVVFFRSEGNITDLYYEAVKCSGLPLCFADGGRSIRISRFLEFEDFHHSWKWPVATQYCSFHRKNSNAPWIALHPEGHHETFRTVVCALEAEIDEHYRLLRANGLPRDSTSVIFYYPLLVLEGPLSLAYDSARGLVLRPADHLQYRTETWFGQQRRAYHIDVIRESYLPRYLKSLHNELEAIRERAAAKRGTVLVALRQQLARVSSKSKRTPLRKLLEPTGNFL